MQLSQISWSSEEITASCRKIGLTRSRIAVDPVLRSSVARPIVEVMTLIACVKALAMVTEKAGIIAVMSDDGDSKTPFPQGLWNSRRLNRSSSLI